MDALTNEPTETSDEPQPDETLASPEPDDTQRKDDLLSLAAERFKQAYEAVKDDFEECAKVQDFIAGDQWPQAIKNARENDDRPCLTLDHLNQYVRHVINAGLMRSRDVRVLPMSGDADDDVASVLAGMVRQITQTSSSKIAYEAGLRHAASVGFGYWECKVIPVPGTNGELLEIQLRRIKDPRMVLLDPFCDYPDGRDAKYAFKLTKLTKKEFKTQYGDQHADAVKSWHQVNSNTVLPWISEDAVVVATYYYFEGETLHWSICTPDAVLDEGVHHGNVLPVVRIVGDEYEHHGKNRNRGMINGSSMDAQRAYNYSSSAFIENVALAPLAPWIAAEGQVEQFASEWKDAHRVPRAVLRYRPVTISGQLAPPPQRAQPAGIPEGWQGMMANLIQDTQMIMGMAQPNVLGTGGIPVQSGVGIEAQKDPGDINTYHYTEHWYDAIEQTGRVILAMIPHVYTQPQAVKIVGDDGLLKTAILNPQQEQTVSKEVGADEKGMQRVLSTSYNPLIGRYDVAITTGPASATKKSETSRMMTTMVQAYPPIMEKAGDLVVASMDMAGADVLAKRLKAFLPPGLAEDDDAAQLQMLQQLTQQNQSLQQQVGELNQIVMGEREQSQAKMAQAQMQAQSALAQSQQQGQADLIQERLKHEGDARIAILKSQVDLENNTRDNIVKVIIEQIRAHNKMDVKIFEHLSQTAQMENHESRMGGYMHVLQDLTQEPMQEPPMTMMPDASALPLS